MPDTDDDGNGNGDGVAHNSDAFPLDSSRTSAGGVGCTVGTVGNGDSTLPVLFLGMALMFVRRSMA
ncbi:MAG: hypothetical protein OSB13_09955 [Porticoccaceae bacterium]|nr:hypothetical protein [Porticoccaceae bacterium]